jgi:hypothetical protein
MRGPHGTPFIALRSRSVHSLLASLTPSSACGTFSPLGRRDLPRGHTFFGSRQRLTKLGEHGTPDPPPPHSAQISPHPGVRRPAAGASKDDGG